MAASFQGPVDVWDWVFKEITNNLSYKWIINVFPDNREILLWSLQRSHMLDEGRSDTAVSRGAELLL